MTTVTAPELLGVEEYIILDYPEKNPVLHQRWPDADWEVSLATAELMEAMSTRGASDGRSLGGLSSVQVQLPGRVVTYCDYATGGFPSLITPHVVDQSKEKREGIEGCFSLPVGDWYTVKRPVWVTIGHVVEDGLIQTTLRGDSARFCLHEIDHLNGVLINDIGRLGR